MIYLKCNNLNVVDAEYWLRQILDVHVLFHNLFTFATMNHHKLYQTLSQNHNHHSSNSASYSANACSTRKLPKNLSDLFNEFNNFFSQQNKYTENIINCKYYKIEEMQSLNNINLKIFRAFFILTFVLSLKILK